MERRNKEDRRPISLAVTFRGVEGGRKWCDGRLVNVSPGGVCLETTNPIVTHLDLFQKLEIRVDLSSHVPSGVFIGEIRWTSMNKKSNLLGLSIDLPSIEKEIKTIFLEPPPEDKKPSS